MPPSVSVSAMYRREVGIRTQLPSVEYFQKLRCTHRLRSLEKGRGGECDVSHSKRTFGCIPKGVPPYGQTSINQIFLFVLPLVVGFLYGSVDGPCLCPVDRLPLHTGQLNNYFDDVFHWSFSLSIGFNSNVTFQCVRSPSVMQSSQLHS